MTCAYVIVDGNTGEIEGHGYCSERLELPLKYQYMDTDKVMVEITTQANYDTLLEFDHENNRYANRIVFPGNIIEGRVYQDIEITITQF